MVLGIALVTFAGIIVSFLFFLVPLRLLYWGMKR